MLSFNVYLQWWFSLSIVLDWLGTKHYPELSQHGEIWEKVCCFIQSARQDGPTCLLLCAEFQTFFNFSIPQSQKPPQKILLLDYCKDRVNTCPQEWLWYIRNFITFCKNHPKFEIYSLYIAKYWINERGISEDRYLLCFWNNLEIFLGFWLLGIEKYNNV